MILDSKLLIKLEKLSFLKLDDNLRSEIVSDFKEVLEFVDVLNEINTDNSIIKTPYFSPLREDFVKDSKVLKDVLAYAPSVRKTFFEVPKIIE